MALCGDQPVAIGSLTRNLLHPHPRHFEYLLAEGVQPEALTPLLHALKSESTAQEGEHSIHVTLQQSDRETIDWAESVGFELIMTTHLGTLHPMRTTWNAPSGLRRLVDTDSAATRRALAVVHAHIYRQQHAWNPPAPIAPEMAAMLFMDEQELMPEATWYATDALGQPIGVASLRKTSAPGVVDLGWIGVLPGVEDSVLRALIGAALHAAGSRLLNIEVDENQFELLAVLRALPVDWRDSIYRYELPPFGGVDCEI